MSVLLIVSSVGLVAFASPASIADAQTTSSTATSTTGTTQTSTTGTTDTTGTVDKGQFAEFVDCSKEPKKDDPNFKTKMAEVHVDCRGSFEASYYLGAAVDNFAGDETIKYLNPDEQGRSTTRFITGFDFGYRLLGNRRVLTYKPETDPTTKTVVYRDNQGELHSAVRARDYWQLWVYGETVHGVRSKEVTCKENGQDTNATDLQVCQKNLAGKNINAGQDAIAILRGATSLEAYVGLRWEFLPLSSLLQGTELDRARAYLKVQYGGVSVSKGGDSADQSLFAVGAVAVSGPLEGSYLEFGTGRNDLMRQRKRHIKVDAFLSARPDFVPMLTFPFMRNDVRIRPFAQMTVDFDAGSGADNYQTYIGWDFTFAKDPRPRK